MSNVAQRDYYFDNIRAFLIYLVVFGHLLQPYTEGNSDLTALYLLIYSFHMPGFLFISGYFAKNVGKEGYLEKIAKKLLVPYFIFFVFFSFYYYFTGKNDTLTLDPFNPEFALWFLLTLFFFHVILVIVKDFNPYIVFPVAIIISLLAGYSEDINSYLSFSRTIVFFPIFYLGYLFNRSHTEQLRNKKWLPVSITILVGFFVFYYFYPINSDWLLGSTPYVSLGEAENSIYSPIKRLLLYGVILLTMFSFFNLMPEQPQWFTYIGRRTMQVYLLHGIVIGLVRGLGLHPFKDPTSPLTYIYLIVASLVIVLILSSRFVCKWTNPVIQLQRPSKFKG
ncbi:acyltransferase family protein [Staphylococcus auricularis]|uniref:Acyltransferase n=1 Tax=Staphylococcus auricularis TaxID=29379 RepID=A0ABX5IDK9_9STAP|nr:acyltransferase family protein [Staphylococcus auricularis]MCE5037716.1 acyltransferase family protein [Staphylococcus auricularis]PTH17475.1 acyltransferase [Staphylococcus auricularis]PTH26070.1 acyltransferase [Staphylococcus auricularis]